MNRAPLVRLDMRAAFAIALLVLPALAGCATQDREPVDVMATFYPLAFLAERLANGTLAVGTMVPGGIEPHEWEPSAADLARAGGAKVFVAQGAGFEPWLPGLRDALGDRAPPIAYATSGLPLRSGEAHDEHEGEEHAAEEPDALDAVDPHTWLDPVLFAQQSRLVEAALVNAFPERADALRAEGERLRADLDALHAELEQGLATCETRTIIANHDAYGYLEDRYGFDVVAISGLSPEAEPSPEDIARAVDAAREHNATIIFFEETVSPRVAETVAREVGAQTRVLSPLETRPEQGTYLDAMRASLASLREAMRCE